MKFQIGDTVSFKNEKLGGIVIDIFKGGKMKVMLDNGFDIDVFENELIKSGTDSRALDKFFKKETPVVKEETPVETKFGRSGELNFITIPAEENHVLSGPVIFVLENKTAFEVPYSFSYQTAFETTGISCGVLKPDCQFITEKYHRGEIKKWTGFHLEFLFFRAGDHKPVKPLTKELSKLLPELQQADKNFHGRNAFARLQLVCDLNEKPLNLERLKDAFKGRNEISSESLSDIFSFSATLEVDLHIDQLTDNYESLTNAEILEIQLGEFRKKMNHAIVKKLRSVTFIHGVGDGILKHCIHKELNDYNGVRYQPGPMGRYGYGATEVLL